MDIPIRDIVIQAIKSVPAVFAYLSDAARGVWVKQFVSYDALRADYFARIYDTVEAYLNADKPITLYRNSLRNMATDYFQEAAELGYQDGGAELPLDDKTQGLVDERIANEIGHIDDLFTGLRDSSIPDFANEAYARADGYAGGLDSIYNLGKTSAAGNQMLTFDGDDGKESCPDCQRLKGQRHRASWWIDNELIPGIPGNENFQCQGYQCQHYLVDDNGDQFTQ